MKPYLRQKSGSSTSASEIQAKKRLPVALAAFF
jgi:hypothetical protein